MHKTLTMLGIAICATLLFGNAALAQQQNAPQPTPVVEIFACNFNNNKNMKDLHSVTARWTTWSDRNHVANYTAFIVTPYLHGQDRPWDVLWLGGWPNGTAMGAGQALWFGKGQDIDAQFAAVIKCPSHAQFAEIVVRTPGGAPPKNGVAGFRDCKIRENHTVPEAMTALDQWGKYLAGRGVNSFEAMLFPLAGLRGDADYTFKLLSGFNSVEELGKFTDIYTGGGFMRANELFGRVLTCANSPRVYRLELVRQAAQQQ